MNEDQRKIEPNYEEIVKRHYKREENWEPLYIDMIPPMVDKESYWALMREIEYMVKKWSWETVYRCGSFPNLIKTQLDWHSQIEKAESKYLLGDDL